MGINAYETAADGSDWDETAANQLSAAAGRITGVGLYPVNQARYTIFKVGSTYYRRDNLDGTIDDSGAAAHTLINTAFDDLTAARDWQEIVHVQGDITLTGSVEPEDYSILEGPCRFTAGAAITMIGASAIDHLTLRDFALDGLTGTYNCRGIHLDHSSGDDHRLQLKNLNIVNCTSAPIEVDSFNVVNIEDVYVKDFSSAVRLVDSSDVFVNESYFIGRVAGGNAMDLVTTSRTSILNCVFTANTTRDLRIYQCNGLTYLDHNTFATDLQLENITTTLTASAEIRIGRNDIAGFTITAGDATTPDHIHSAEIQAPYIHDATDAQATVSNLGDLLTISCADGQDVTVRWNVHVPQEYQHTVAAILDVASPCTGGTVMRWNMATDFAGRDEVYNVESDSIAATDTTLAANAHEYIDVSAAFTGLDPGDQIGVAFQREGSHANDTLGAVLHIIGFHLQYV
jgi:hypothetical protein